MRVTGGRFGVPRLIRSKKPSQLRREDQIDIWFDALWASALGATLALSGYKFLNSAAWQRVLDFTPGSRVTVVAVILIFGLTSLLLIATARRWVTTIGVSGWCFFVASFQVFSAFHDEAGPLGFFAWYYVSFQLLKHAFQTSTRSP